MKLRELPYELTVCKLKSVESISLTDDILFVGKTEDEISLVCETNRTPANTTEREDGWKALVICGTLDFSLVGILSKISTVLAEAGVGIFAVSTYNTDYILVKAKDLARAETALAAAGYSLS